MKKMTNNPSEKIIYCPNPTCKRRIIIQLPKKKDRIELPPEFDLNKNDFSFTKTNLATFFNRIMNKSWKENYEKTCADGKKDFNFDDFIVNTLIDIIKRINSSDTDPILILLYLIEYNLRDQLIYSLKDQNTKKYDLNENQEILLKTVENQLNLFYSRAKRLSFNTARIENMDNKEFYDLVDKVGFKRIMNIITEDEKKENEESEQK